MERHLHQMTRLLTDAQPGRQHCATQQMRTGQRIGMRILHALKFGVTENG
jgi:hypothetical protein